MKQTKNIMTNEEKNPASCQTAVSSSGYIHNPMTIEEIVNNAIIQIGNIDYYLTIKDYQSALIKADRLVSKLKDIIALERGL